MTTSTSCVCALLCQLFTVEVVRRSFLSVYVPLSKQAILAWKQALVLKMFAAWKLFQAKAGPGSHIGLHNPYRIWPISFHKLHFWSNPFQCNGWAGQLKKYIIIIDCTGIFEPTSACSKCLQTTSFTWQVCQFDKFQWITKLLIQNLKMLTNKVWVRGYASVDLDGNENSVLINVTYALSIQTYSMILLVFLWSK